MVEDAKDQGPSPTPVHEKPQCRGGPDRLDEFIIEVALTAMHGDSHDLVDISSRALALLIVPRRKRSGPVPNATAWKAAVPGGGPDGLD